MDKMRDLFLKLRDYELISLVRDRVFEEIRNTSSDDELGRISEIKFYLITASIFDMEMHNGGLCQFLVNQGHFHGPMLETALLAFGAQQHGRLIADFCEKNGIDLCNLQELVPESGDPYSASERFMQWIGKYPFEDFDKAYFTVDGEYPLEGILGAYIRNNLTLFA